MNGKDTALNPVISHSSFPNPSTVSEPSFHMLGVKWATCQIYSGIYILGAFNLVSVHNNPLSAMAPRTVCQIHEVRLISQIHDIRPLEYSGTMRIIRSAYYDNMWGGVVETTPLKVSHISTPLISAEADLRQGSAPEHKSALTQPRLPQISQTSREKSASSAEMY